LLPSPLGSLSAAATAAPRRAAAAAGLSPLLLRRRAPIAGALLFLSLGAFAGVRSLSSSASARMESTSTTVPSIVVYVTVPNKEAGKRLAGSIISEKLAACVNIVPGIESVYWWEGKVQTDAEELLIIKTRESLLDALTEHVKANHEYDVPEVIALPIKGGNLKYLEWLKNSTRES
ncbi:Os10g0378300, partial [Oryza sativa Japonica Group]